MVMRARCATRSTAWQRVFGLMFLWSVMAHDQSGPSYAVQSGDICPAGGADIPGGHASSYGRAVIADHLALMYGRTQRVRELGRHCAVAAEQAMAAEHPYFINRNILPAGNYSH